MVTELIVITNNTNASLDLMGDVPVSLNYAIADIKDPSKRNGAFSKTIKLPGSPTNNKFFEHIYDVNVVTNNFNPNLKTECYVLQDSIEVFRGYLRLREIEVELVNDTQKIVYDVTILGDNQDLFGAIGDSKLQDLDVSAFDHVYNRVNQKASWLATLGSGYVYPLIDYGYTNNFLTNYYKVEHFRPAFFVKQYIDLIFAAAGKTYTSSFLNSTFFKRWIIPHNGDKFTMNASDLANYEFYVGDTGASTANSKALQSTGSTFSDWWTGDLFTSTSSSYTMKYNDDTTNPFVDTGNVYDTTTGVITLAQTGTYALNLSTDFEIKLATIPAGTVSVSLQNATGWTISYKVLLSTDGGSTWTIIYNDTPNFQTSVLTTSYQTFAKTFAIPATSFNTGDQLRILVHPLYSASGYGLVFSSTTPAITPITSGTASIEWRFRSTATAKFKLTAGDYVSGQNLVINDAIPKDIKQKDFLTSIFKMANLYVDIDPNDTNNYLIEPRDDYFSTGVTKDWSSKLALDKPFNIKLMAEVDVKNFIYKYKSDTDYYNKKYEDLYQEPYGTHTQVVVNDFTLKDDKNEVIFSPTPIVNNSNNTMIIPKIFSYDGTNIKPQKHNIRILMYNGVETISSGTWDYVAPSSDALGAAILAQSTYPACAMVDDPLAPTESIEFGVPNTVFYTLGSNYTTNNLYNAYYSKFIAECTDRDSRIVTAYFYLTPTDIALFDFRDKIFVKDTLYFVNKISDYNKLKPGLTKVELLKIKTASAYVPATPLVSQIETNSTNTGITARMFGGEPDDTNVGNANNVLIGDNNSSRSVGSFISGSRNAVGEDCSRVSIISTVQSNVNSLSEGINLVGCSGINVGEGCQGINLFNCINVNIEDYVYDFTGVNLVNDTITSSDSGTTRIETISNIAENPATKTASFDVDPNISLYYIDCTGGNIVAMYDFSTDVVNKTIKFIRTDATANTFSIDEISGTATLEGAGVPVNLGMVQWESLHINNNGINFFIT